MSKNKIKSTRNPKNKKGNIKLTESVPYADNLNYPIFCFRHLIKSHDLDQCNDSEKKQFVSQLVLLSNLSWDDIRLSPRHGMGYERISKKSLRISIPSIVTDDVDHLLSLRFDGMKCFLGMRVRSVFHVIAIDRSFDCYNHGK